MAKSKGARRMRALGRGAGLKRSAVSLGAGAATGLAAGKLAENIEFLRKKWYITPLVVAAGGHLMKATRLREGADAVIGAAGAMAYFNYELAKGNEMVVQAPETSGVQETRGVDDYLAEYNRLGEAAGVQDMPARARSSVMSLQG